MARFLTEKTLTKPLRQLLAGVQDVRIAVAFWGDGAAKILNLKKATGGRIICNLGSGACNPTEIRALMKRFKVRTHDRLHAKIYWTPDGFVSGSSNASTNGLVIPASQAPGWCEANLLVTDAALVDEVGAWFEVRWGETKHITKASLREAERKWNIRVRTTGQLSVQGKTLLAAALSKPSSFKDHPIYLAIYSERLSKAANDVLRKLNKSKKSQKLDDGTKVSFKNASMYEDWPKIQPGAWLIDCDFVNIAKPRVHGIYRVPNPIAAIELPDGEGIVAFRDRGYRFAGKLFRMPPKERRIVQKHMKLLSKAAWNRKHGLLHIADAARLIIKANH